MKNSKLGKFLTGRAEIREQLKFKNYICGLLILFGVIIVGLNYFNTLPFKFDGAFDSIGAVLIVFGIARIIKNNILLKNDKNLKAYEISLNDERNINITRRALSCAVITCIYIGAVFIIVFLPTNHLVAMTISYSMCLFFVIYLMFSFIFNKIM